MTMLFETLKVLGCLIDDPILIENTNTTTENSLE
jgi:hypothetical protein